MDPAYIRSFNAHVKNFVEILHEQLPEDTNMNNVCGIFRIWYAANTDSTLLFKHFFRIINTHQNAIRRRDRSVLQACNSLWFFKNFGVDLIVYLDRLSPVKQEAAWQYITLLAAMATKNFSLVPSIDNMEDIADSSSSISESSQASSSPNEESSMVPAESPMDPRTESRTEIPTETLQAALRMLPGGPLVSEKMLNRCMNEMRNDSSLDSLINTPVMLQIQEQLNDVLQDADPNDIQGTLSKMTTFLLSNPQQLANVCGTMHNNMSDPRFQKLITNIFSEQQ